MFIHCSFDATKNKLDCYRSKNSIKRFFKDLKEHAAKIINCEKRKMISITDEKNRSYEKQNICYIYKKGFDKKYHKVRGHCYCTGKCRRAAHDICNPRHKTSKRIPVVFPNGSTYDYHFVISEQAKKMRVNLHA